MVPASGPKAISLGRNESQDALTMMVGSMVRMVQAGQASTSR